MEEKLIFYMSTYPLHDRLNTMISSVFRDHFTKKIDRIMGISARIISDAWENAIGKPKAIQLRVSSHPTNSVEPSWFS